MRILLSLVLAITVVLGVLTLRANNEAVPGAGQPREEAQDGQREDRSSTASPATNRLIEDTSDAADSAPLGKKSVSGSARSTPPARPTTIQPAVTGTENPAVSLAEAVSLAGREVALWTAEDFKALGNVEALDAEGLFQAYKFLASCIGHPSSFEALEARSEEYRRWHRRSPENFTEESLAGSLAGLEAGLARCGGLDIDYEARALEVLGLAVQRGYMPAQLTMVIEGREHLFRDADRVFREPGRLAEYTDLAQASLANLTALGIPESFALQAVVQFEGYFQPPDPVAGLGWALLAEQELQPSMYSAYAQRVIDQARGLLEDDQMQEAERFKRQLCATLC